MLSPCISRVLFDWRNDIHHHWAHRKELESYRLILQLKLRMGEMTYSMSGRILQSLNVISHYTNEKRRDLVRSPLPSIQDNA